MNFENFKGTVYDFFGYFSPGALLLIVWLIAFEHSKGSTDIYPIIKGYANNKTVIEILVFVLLCYILGHAIASISSFIIEINIIRKIKYFDSKLYTKNILHEDLYEQFEKKFSEVFHTSFKENMFRTVICHVQAKQNSIYETAFVFLSFYGMARNFSLIFGSGVLWEVFNLFFHKSESTILFIILYLILMWVFGYEYFRFTKYYKDQIANGFLIP